MMNFEVYKENNNDLSFRLIDDTGKILVSGMQFKQKDQLLLNIESVKKNLSLNKDVEKNITAQGKYFFNVKGAHGQLAGTSIAFASPQIRDRWLHEIQKEMPHSQIVEAMQ
jgi:uncharacterized protein